MSSSPYLNEHLKAYLTKFKIEPLINSCINGLARQTPEDPYSYIIQTFEKHASQEIEFVGVEATEVMSCENVPVLSATVTVKHLAKEYTFAVKNPWPVCGDGNMIYDEERLGGKGQNKGIAFLKKLGTAISKKNCSQQSQIDSILLKQYQQNQKKGLYQLNICSYLPPLIQSHILSQPLFKTFSQLSNHVLPSSKPQLNVLLNCLQGSKLVNSKCKPFKFFLIGQKLTDPYQLTILTQAIRKTITSGKGGQSALKIHTDGSFLCPADTINDNLKILQDAIISTNNKQKFTIGISWLADNFYVAQQKKYQLQNPKALLDTDQLIEYYFKLANDKPLISYYEDPVFTEDLVAWGKLLGKFRETKVRIGSRRLYGSIEGVRKYGVTVTKEEFPELEEAAINEMNGRRVVLQMHFYKSFEMETLSKLLAIKKALKPIKTIMLLGDNTYQTHDTTQVDLCVGLGAYIVMGMPLKFDRLNKLNRMKQLLQ